MASTQSAQDLQRALSKLILAIWDNSAVKTQVQSNPLLLKNYGFATVPTAITFAVAQGAADVQGFSTQLSGIEAGGPLTIYIPPKPAEGAAAADDTSYCCCCCPCCCCT
jgi:hypothetical protein